MYRKKIFIVAATFILSMFAAQAQTQTPGNISNATPVVWLTPDSYNDGTWTNKISGTVGNFVNPGRKPNKINTGYNFHQSVEFPYAGAADPTDANGYWLLSQNGYNLSANENITAVFVLQRASSYGTFDHLFTFNGYFQSTPIAWYGSSGNQFRWAWSSSDATERGRDISTNVSEGIIVLDNANNNSGGIDYRFNGTGGNVAVTTFGSRALSNQRMAIASGENDRSYYPYEGTIQEIVILKSNTAHLSATDLQKIHSYLAIKYGITLNNNDNYVASNGTTVVWNRTANNGYNNNIFGIARDDTYGLYQKQSQSASLPIFTAFVGTNVADLNINNTSGLLNNGVYAMFGSNGLDINNVVQLGIGNEIPVPNSTSVVNYRKALVYKAQITGAPAISVKLKVADAVPLPEYVLISTDPNFPAGSTQVITVKGNIIEGELQNGCYIAFGGYMSGANKGPGGVLNNLKLWLRADEEASLVTELLPAGSGKLQDYPDATAGTVAAVSEWKDIVRNQTYSYAMGEGTTSGHLEPVYLQSNYMTNYHPAVRFWGTGTTRATWLGNTATNIFSEKYPAKHSAFFVVNNDFGTNDWVYTMMFGSASANSYYGPGYGVQKDGNIVVGRFRTNTTEGAGTLDLFKPGATSILGYHHWWPGGTGGTGNSSVKFRFNGKEDTRTGITHNTYFGLNQASMIGKGYTHDRVIQGVMSEVIMYNGELQPADLQHIESYLAIKYGITLSPSDQARNRFDYVFSDGMMLWNGTAGVNTIWDTYYYRIAAAIRDDNAGLNNRHSHSTNVGSIVHMGVAGAKLGTRAEVGVFDYDTEAVVWGDDNASGTETVLPDGACGDIESIFNRKWLVHKLTEGNRPIQMLVGAQNNTGNQLDNDPGTQGLFDKLSAGNDVYMIVADSAEKLIPGHPRYGQFKAVVPMRFLDGEQQCSYTFTDTITYITFGYKANRKGCAGEVEFEGSKTFPWTQWTRQNYGSSLTMTKGPYDLGSGVSVTSTAVAYQSGIAVPVNYPSVTNTPASGSLYIQRRNGAMDSKVTVTINFNTPVIPEFSLSDLDGYLGRFEKVSVMGYCSSGGVLPVLSYASSPGSSSYKIEGNSARVTAGRDLTPGNRNGRVDVTFQGGVTQIVIEYSITGNQPLSGITSNLIISPINVRQTPPPPPVNEDGLSFVKDVRERDITTCEPAEYSFYIENVNCEPKYVKFSDTLPAKLKWLADIGLDSINGFYNSHIHFNSYAGTNILIIDSLLVPGSTTLKFTATAMLDDDAVPQGQTVRFNNRAVLDYTQIVNNVPLDRRLQSLDRETLEEQTWFNATWAQRQNTVQLTATASPGRYAAQREITVTIAVNNPNPAITDMYLEIRYDAGFTYVTGSYNNAAGSAPVTPPDPYLLSIAGNSSGTAGFTLPTGSTTFTFKLLAPTQSNLQQAYDNDGNPIPNKVAPLNVNYEFFTEMEDPCVILSMSDMAGELQVPYGARTHIIINEYITTKVIK